MDGSPRHPAFVLVTLLVTMAACLVPASAAVAAAPNFERLLATQPFARLWTEANSCAAISETNSLTGEALDTKLEELTRWYRHFNAQASNRFVLGRDCRGTSSSSLATKLTARGAWVSNYRNGSSTSQSTLSMSLNFDEAMGIERRAPLAIGTYWPGNWRPDGSGDQLSGVGRLLGSITEATRILRIEAAGSTRPANTRGTWPYLNSRGSGLEAGAYSRNTHDFVSWVRIGREIAQIVERPRLEDGVVTLRVRRGIWDTRPRAYEEGTRVMSPVYVGSASRDVSLSGVPGRDDPAFPLRYSIKIWTDAGQQWIIDRIRSTFGDGWQGHNAVWLDTTSCSQYSNSDPYGNQVFGWDDRVEAKLTADAWGEAQRSKLEAIQEAFPTRQVIANNLGGRTPCNERLLADAVDGGGFERWMMWGPGHSFDWTATMQQAIDVETNDWPAMFWVRWKGGVSGGAAQYRRLTYGSYLLARRPRSQRPMYGGPWDLRRPEDLYFWNWGRPRETPATPSDLRIDGTPLYRRRYAKGIVIVNPSSSDVAYSLGATFYDVVDLTRAGVPRAVTSVTVPARDSAFLLRSA